MSLDKEENKFECKIKYRLIDHSFGKYYDITSLEVEEGVRSTLTMSEEDILFFRPVHWLIQFLWNFRFYFDLLKYLQSLKVNPIDYIIKAIEGIEEKYAPPRVKEIFSEFNKEAREEWFDSAEAARAYYGKPEQFKLLKDGYAGGKMNFKYIFRVLLEAREDFEKYLYETAINCSSVCDSKKGLFKDIFNFLSSSIIDFRKDWDEICEERAVDCNYDILAWRNSKYKKDLFEFYQPEGIRYTFYLPEEQRISIKTLLTQYENENINVTLRKMAEYMDITDLLYQVKVVKKNKVYTND
jgi:hypothetical protein